MSLNFRIVAISVITELQTTCLCTAFLCLRYYQYKIFITDSSDSLVTAIKPGAKERLLSHRFVVILHCTNSIIL